MIDSTTKIGEQSWVDLQLSVRLLFWILSNKNRRSGVARGVLGDIPKIFQLSLPLWDLLASYYDWTFTWLDTVSVNFHNLLLNSFPVWCFPVYARICILIFLLIDNHRYLKYELWVEFWSWSDCRSFIVNLTRYKVLSLIRCEGTYMLHVFVGSTTRAIIDWDWILIFQKFKLDTTRS